MKNFQNALHYPASEFLARLAMVSCLAAQGKTTEAAIQLKEALTQQPDLTLRKLDNRFRHLCEDYKIPYLENLRQAGLPE